MASTPLPALPPPRRHRSAADALSTIRAVTLTSAIIAGLYLGQDFLIPLALAVLITFLLSPFVTKLERWIGNVGAVIATMTLILGGTLGLGWVLGNQAVDLANQFPGYKENIRAKLHAFEVPSGGVLDRVSQTVEELKKDLPGVGSKDDEDSKTADGAQEGGPMPVKVVETPDSTPFQMMKSMAAPILGPLGTAGLVLLLATFMLLKRDDLRARLIRLIGQGKISATTRALDDASTRVRRYLLMQLVVNVTYGIPLAIGLYFIGVPNAILWGALAAVLRFIPYIGPWIAAAFPILLSLAASPTWWTPLLTMGLFVVLELISNNVMEPWLYGSSTGVSPVALIVAAVFWTWMWGTAGLVLATPFTVCLVVMGRHIPQLSFLSVVLGEEEALTPAEDCYHRMLRQGEHDEEEFVDSYLRTKPLEELYDAVLVPVVASAEEDHRQGMIDSEQRDRIAKSTADIIEDLREREHPTEEAEALPRCRVHCIPARAERDELAGVMLEHLLDVKGFDASHSPDRRSAGELIKELEKRMPDLACITVVAPSIALHARNLCQKIRAALPEQKIIVCLWGANGDGAEDIKSLKEAGAEDVVKSLADAVSWCERFAVRLAAHREGPPIPDNEEERLLTLDKLGLINPDREPVLDHVTAKMSRVFEVPVAAITLVDRERQFFKAYTGLPEELAEERESPRDLAVCSHVVAANSVVVVEDLKRDRRFVGNPLLVKHSLRFYAGAPIRSANGHVLGALCVMDTEPRRFTVTERRLLEQNAAEVAEEIERLAATEA
ncbi:AI-2E family transporter [Luteolibacter luteus]|uniref:AI-2E family transporter n=1 Tax=Luteolibacter luteus TaxID=2728835 RepID=A0A858RLN1_9BACT|nr:AI-2E family transporter [Luteolibacter luteus]QJE97368.1 AI-2E family transporter [Luteolibacter luteus]